MIDALSLAVRRARERERVAQEEQAKQQALTETPAAPAPRRWNVILDETGQTVGYGEASNTVPTIERESGRATSVTVNGIRFNVDRDAAGRFVGLTEI